MDADIPSYHDLEQLTDEEFQNRIRPLMEMNGGYAYPLGYVQNGRYSPAPCDPTCTAPAPCPSWRTGRRFPARTVCRGTSPNHHGQNVLFLGGGVRFCPKPYNPFDETDHLFLNNDGKVAAGVNSGHGPRRPGRSAIICLSARGLA